MCKFITSLFHKNKKEQKVPTEILLNKLAVLSSKEKWNFSYILFKKLFDTFDFEILREIVDKLPLIHQKGKFNQSEIDEIQNQINMAVFEYYISLNEAGHIANLLATKSDFEIEDAIQVIQHFMQIGECNFQSDELATWNNNIEICWDIFTQEKNI